MVETAANTKRVGSGTKGPDAPQASANQPAAISLPKGGGAIKGISEKFSANPVTGTSSFSISLPVSPARGLEPQLSLNYDSGSGNGPFGLGWSLGLPSISRKTAKGLPQYSDLKDSDTYVLSGAEDLVPLLEERNGNWQAVTADKALAGVIWEVKLYRPRIESAFTLIERWRNPVSGIVWWRTTTGNNVTAVFGYHSTARVADPAHPERIFKWLIDCSYDDKGHYTQYVYKSEDMRGVDHDLAYERHRKTHPVTQTYLKRVCYGIKKPHHLLYENIDEVLEKPFTQDDFHFQTVFDYGEHTQAEPAADEDTEWNVRHDAFSYYRAGFEIRTYRRCKRVLLFHQFEKELPTACEPVSEVAFTYDDQNEAFSFLDTITSTGYKREKDGLLSARSPPPMTFGYQAHAWDSEIKSIDTESLQHLPGGVDGRRYQWVDLYNEALSGVLSEQAGGLYYKQNLGGARFAEARLVSPAPSVRGLNTGALQIQDLQSNGSKCLVSTTGPLKGFYKLDVQDGLRNFQPFSSMPNVDFQDRNLRVIDLDGDGRADLLVSEEQAFRWYPSSGEDGYEEARLTVKARDEDTGPSLVFANDSESIFLADMSGDGLTDIVRIRNGSVVYWPNLGYGRFGAKVSMAHAPHFNHPDLFDPGHIRLADLDGSGPTDIAYLGKDEFRYWLNQSGNSWSTPYAAINPFPELDNLSTVSVVDLLGTGTACIVWSSPLPKHTANPIRYIDLMRSTKPHLMKNYQNGMGKELNLSYTPSTQFYLEDREKGEPWITRLHFPVHCLSKVETFDHISKARFASSYSYHHGYYDHAEREFRGFGRVDQIDTEDYEHFVKGESSNVVERVLHQTPMLIKTWFHNGFYLDKDHILSQYQAEYFSSESLQDFILGEPELPEELSAAEWREALRACKGMALRSEVYGLDGSEDETKPYSIAQSSCEIKRIQPKGNSRFASFQIINSESLSLQIDRNPDDPRVSHNLILQTDDYGNPILSATVGYPRIISDPAAPEEVRDAQAETHIVVEQTEYTEDTYGIFGDYNIDDPVNTPYRTPVNWKSTTYELHGFLPDAYLFSRNDLLSNFEGAVLIGYENPINANEGKRTLSQSEVRFINDRLDGARNAGETSPLGITWETYQLAFTPALLQSIYGDKVDNTSFDGGYVDLNGDGSWWVPSGTPIYSVDAADRFYTPDGAHDALGHPLWIDLDQHHLLPIRTRDAKQNETLAVNDYRTLQAQYLRDPNHNWSGVETDELGMVIKSAIMGKVSGLNEGEAPADDAITEGDNLDYPSAELDYGYFDPVTNQPAYVYSKSYINHHAVDASEQRGEYLQQHEYFDGSGNIIMVKTQAEPGIARRRNQAGSIEDVDTGSDPRWIGNGRTILNNKGNPVKQYEPYFSVTPEYEDDPALVEIGITPILFYDAAGRNDCKLNPNKTYEKVFFSPWQQISWDVNDTLFIQNADSGKDLDPANDPHVGHYFAELDENDYAPTWYAARIDGDLGVEQQRAALKTEPHANTPARVYTDALGRTIYSIADNGERGQYKTRTQLDIEGNTLAVIDDRNNTVMAYAYNMLPPPDEENPKPVLYQNSMDSGEKWNLLNVMGNPLRSWDSRDHVFESHYDELNRPAESNVLEKNVIKTVAVSFYHDSDSTEADSARENNLIGVAYESYDQAGLTEVLERDFKGNLTRSRRTFAVEYKETISWSVTDLRAHLLSEYFETTAEYDAQNRVTYSRSPHNHDLPASETWLAYNESGALDSVDVAIRSGTRKTYVSNIDYDAKGQRQKVGYGNGVITRYEYEDNTYRLKRLLTTRNASENLQDLNYFYDPAGNISEIRDYAQSTIYYDNALVEPNSNYVYDPLYRLIEASGREHATQANVPHPDNGWEALQAADDLALQNYIESYEYDGVGNIISMAHRRPNDNNSGWTRHYDYASSSNRLLATTLGDPSLPFTDTYDYNEHGSMISMPHLPEPGIDVPSMDWDFAEQLQHVYLEGGGNAWYAYDANGKRVRKIVETNGSTIKERIYLGSWEIYRETVAGNLRLEREIQHVMDDQSRVALIEIKTVSDEVLVSSPIPVIRYQLGNHLGSASLELSDDGNIVSYEEYHPYGTTSYHAGTSVVEESPKRYRYTGMERDEETGFSYHGARYLALWLMRWINADPMGISDGVCIFAYAKNNPVNFSDENGMQSSFNSGEFMGFEVDPDTGIKYARFKAIEGTWISASMKALGFDRQFSKTEGYGAYVPGMVIDPTGIAFDYPDVLEVGQEYLIPTLDQTSLQPEPVIDIGFSPNPVEEDQSWGDTLWGLLPDEVGVQFGFSGSGGASFIQGGEVGVAEMTGIHLLKEGSVAVTHTLSGGGSYTVVGQGAGGGGGFGVNIEAGWIEGELTPQDLPGISVTGFGAGEAAYVIGGQLEIGVTRNNATSDGRNLWVLHGGGDVTGGPQEETTVDIGATGNRTILVGATKPWSQMTWGEAAVAPFQIAAYALASKPLFIPLHIYHLR